MSTHTKKRVRVECSYCGGMGKTSGGSLFSDFPFPCPRCNRTGGFLTEEPFGACPDCLGIIGLIPCSTCFDRGIVALKA